MIYGHATVVAELTSHLPPVSIFLGPLSVGKTSTAEYVRDYYEILDSDYAHFEFLDADAAVEISRLAQTHPNGERRLIVIQMGGALRRFKDALLISIEHAYEGIHFILISSEPLPKTVTSRGRVFKFPLLSQDDMEKVLRSILSSGSNIERLARASGGQVFRAFTLSKLAKQRSEVIQVLNAFSSHDPSFIERASKNWTDDHTNLVETWCQESITERWRVFEPDEVMIKDRKLAIRVLLALRGGVRPRLVVRSGLMDIWKEYTS